jgi:hypothetical protein
MSEVLQYLEAGAHESLSPTSSTGITAAIQEPTSGEYNNIPALAALITVEDNSTRFTVDGTTPTNSNGTSADTGHLITAGQSYVIEARTGVVNFRCIDAVSGSASVVKVTTFFKRN